MIKEHILCGEETSQRRRFQEMAIIRSPTDFYNFRNIRPALFGAVWSRPKLSGAVRIRLEMSDRGVRVNWNRCRREVIWNRSRLEFALTSRLRPRHWLTLAESGFRWLRFRFRFRIRLSLTLDDSDFGRLRTTPTSGGISGSDFNRNRTNSNRHGGVGALQRAHHYMTRLDSLNKFML